MSKIFTRKTSLYEMVVIMVVGLAFQKHPARRTRKWCLQSPYQDLIEIESRFLYAKLRF